MSQNLSSAAVVIGVLRVNSFLVSSGFCRLLLTFSNSFSPDQDRHCVGPYLDVKMFDTLMVFLKECFEKKFFLTGMSISSFWRISFYFLLKIAETKSVRFEPVCPNLM